MLDCLKQGTSCFTLGVFETNRNNSLSRFTLFNILSLVSVYEKLIDLINWLAGCRFVSVEPHRIHRIFFIMATKVRAQTNFMKCILCLVSSSFHFFESWSNVVFCCKFILIFGCLLTMYWFIFFFVITLYNTSCCLVFFYFKIIKHNYLLGYILLFDLSDK